MKKERMYILSDGRAVIARDEDQAVFHANVFGGLQLTARQATKAELAAATAEAVAAQRQRDPGWHAPTWNGRQILAVSYSMAQGITARCLQSLAETSVDGRYILRPDGGAWQYVEIANGRVVRSTEESNVASHAAASDSLAFLADLDLDILPEADDPAAVLAVAMPEADPALVEVLRVEK